MFQETTARNTLDFMRVKGRLIEGKKQTNVLNRFKRSSGQNPNGRVTF